MEEKKRQTARIYGNPALFGAGGAFLMMAAYIAILTAANSLEHAVAQFYLMWPWIMALAFGFGIQAGLYAYARGFSKNIVAGTATTSSMVASGGVSTSSMAACCAHHIADFLPIFGLGAAALLLAKYQTPFMLLGIVSNALGIIFILHILQKHNLFDNKGMLSYIMKADMKKAFGISAVAGAIAVANSFAGV